MSKRKSSGTTSSTLATYRSSKAASGGDDDGDDHHHRKKGKCEEWDYEKISDDEEAYYENDEPHDKGSRKLTKMFHDEKNEREKEWAREADREEAEAARAAEAEAVRAAEEAAAVAGAPAVENFPTEEEIRSYLIANGGRVPMIDIKNNFSPRVPQTAIAQAAHHAILCRLGKTRTIDGTKFFVYKPNAQ